MDAIAENPGGDFQIDRKLVKKAVMAYGYGITAHSMMEDIGDVIFERLRPVDNADEDGDGVLGRQWKILCPQEDATASDDGADDSGDDDAKEKDYTFGKIKSYLQRVILEAIEEKALAAAAVMKVLKGLAGTLTRTPGEGGTGCGPIAWTSPAGFPVYFVEEKRRYKTLRTNLYPDAATRRKDEVERKERKDRNRKGARSVTLRVIDDDAEKAALPRFCLNYSDVCNLS